MTDSDFDLRHLRLFVALAEELHFGRAARRMFMTQPPLSKGIRHLEETLGLQLFERDSKRVVLTPMGRVMLAKAREALRQAENTLQFARAIASGHAGRIEIGFTAVMLYRGLADVIDRFGKAFPDIEASFQEATTQRQIDLVKDGLLDAGFINSPLPPPGVASLLVQRERYVACIPATHPLARRKHIPLEALRDAPFLIFSRDHSRAYHDQMMSMCAAAGFQPLTKHFGGQLLTLVAMVSIGFGVALVPESLKAVGIRGVSFVRLRGSAPIPAAFLIWNAKRLTPALDAFIGTTRETLAVD